MTLIPPFRLAYFLFTNGENCGTNDDIYYLEQFARMSSSGYNWLNYFSDTFLFGHCTAFNQLVFNLFVVLGHLNQNLGAAIGLVLIAIRLALIFDMIFSTTNKIRWYCLPLLSALIFAPTGASILTQGTFAITWQLALTLAAAALWAIFRSTGTAAIIMASICIVLGSWTIATALMTIPIVWLCAWRLKLLNKLNLLLLGTATALAIFPDLLYLEHGASTFGPITEVLKSPDFSMFLSSLGRNFAPGTAWYLGRMAPAEVFSAFGLVLFTAAVALARQAKKRNNLAQLPIQFYAAMAVASFAIGNLLLTTMVRNLIAPWYGQISIWFWLGLVGMAASLLDLANEKYKSAAKIFAATTCISIASFTLFSPSLEDKEFCLDNRSPAYLSALRNYTTPSQPGLLPPYKYADFTVPRLAKLLERYHLPPFANEDTVLFQGDCVIPELVQFQNDGTDACQLFFCDDQNKMLNVTDYKRLNLVLEGAMTVTWHVKIPSDATFAELTTALSQLNYGSEKAAMSKANTVSLRVNGNQPQVYEVEPTAKKVKVDLLLYRGQTADIVFSQKQNNLSTTLLEAPKVEIRRQ